MLNFWSLLLIGVVGTAIADSVQHWSVTDRNTGLTCIVVEAVPTITITFDDQSYTFLLNKTNNVSGDCSLLLDAGPRQLLSLDFFPNGATPASPFDAQGWHLDLMFSSVSTIGSYQLIDYELLTSRQSFMKGSRTKLFRKVKSAEKSAKSAVYSHDSNGFKCSSITLPLDYRSYIVLKDLRVIAFAKMNETSFDSQQGTFLSFFGPCVHDVVVFKGGKTYHGWQLYQQVPLLVGVCLSALVIIVLVVYLIRRSRAQRQGYAGVLLSE